MKLPKHYFENLTAEKYREYLKLLPDLKKENVRIITYLIFTFAALTFFGIFAINPTLSTIITLKKQLSDCTYVVEQLTTKIANLTALQTKYNQIQPQLPVLFDAIPQTPKAPTVMGQIMSLAELANLHIKLLQVNEVQLNASKNIQPTGQSFVFTIEAQGEYADMTRFITSVATLNRLIAIENTTITKDVKLQNLVLNIRGRVFFQR